MNVWSQSGVKSVKEQLTLLSKLLDVKPNPITNAFLEKMLPFLQKEVDLPDWVDGWFIYLNPFLDYAEKVLAVFQSEFANRGWHLKEDPRGRIAWCQRNRKFSEKTRQVYENILSEQQGNYWVVPMNLGRQFVAEKKPATIKEGAPNNPEFEMGPIEAICAMLTHMDERLFDGCMSKISFPGIITEVSARKLCAPALIWNKDTPSFLGFGLPESEDKDVCPVMGYYNW